MNKTKILKAILAPIGKGILIFAVFGLALYAYGSIVYPPQPTPVTGVVGQFVGVTNAVDGNRGGYPNANALCNSAFAGSHICTPMEIINTYNHNPLVFNSYSSGRYWVNNGPPSYVENLSNDCGGWKNGTPAAYGSVINFSGLPFVNSSFYIQPCSAKYAFACCK